MPNVVVDAVYNPATSTALPITYVDQGDGTYAQRVSVGNATDLSGFANVAQSQTDTVLVAAVATKKIRVKAVFCQAGGVATNVTFNSKGAGAGTAISATRQNGANGGAVSPYNPSGWFETNAGEALTVTTGAGSTTGIEYAYDLV